MTLYVLFCIFAVVVEVERDEFKFRIAGMMKLMIDSARNDRAQMIDIPYLKVMPTYRLRVGPMRSSGGTLVLLGRPVRLSLLVRARTNVANMQRVHSLLGYRSRSKCRCTFFQSLHCEGYSCTVQSLTFCWIHCYKSTITPSPEQNPASA
jgi:hypothetical protein